MAVVALCTQENDVIHAGYLALALLFFRRRDALRSRAQQVHIPQPILKSACCRWTDRPCGQTVWTVPCGQLHGLMCSKDAEYCSRYQ